MRPGGDDPGPPATPARQRIDKWLWHARVTRTRTLAQRLLGAGKVRLNREKVTEPSRSVQPEDVLTIGHGGRVRVLKVKAIADHRGGASVAAALYEELGEAGGAGQGDRLSRSGRGDKAG